MNDFIPTNDLDRALIAVQRSRAAVPDLYRQLAEGDLCLLMPYQPELENEALVLENGMEFPFVRLSDEEGDIVPIFSSSERAEEGTARGNVPPRTYLIGSMPARQVMEILGQTNLRAIINKSCSTPQFIIPPDLMREIASGELLEPLPEGATETAALTLLDPADYPTDLIQPVFEFCRQHRQYRAAWIFDSPAGRAKVAATGGRAYQLLFLMDPRDRVVHHDLNMVIAAAVTEGDDVTHGQVDETDPVYIAEIFSVAGPFYVAADFAQPRRR